MGTRTTQQATSNSRARNPMVNHSQWQRRAGFTLVELVAVILILGILSAVAIPRYMDVRASARTAKIEALYGHLKVAANTAHMASLTSGNKTSVSMEGNAVALVNGYPAASASGIEVAANLDATRDGISINHVAGTPASTQVTYPDVIANVSGGTLPCSVTYSEPAAAGDAPTFTKDATGC